MPRRPSSCRRRPIRRSRCRRRRTKRGEPFPRNLLPADYFRVNPQHAHWPLVVMLVLTQLSVGAFVVGTRSGALAQRPVAALRCVRCTRSRRLDLALLALGGQPASFGSAAVCVSRGARAAAFVAESRDRRVRSVRGVGVGVCGRGLRRTAMPETNAAGGERRRAWIRWLGWSVAAAGVDRRVLLGDDLCVHAARMLELRARRRAIRA